MTALPEKERRAVFYSLVLHRTDREARLVR